MRKSDLHDHLLVLFKDFPQTLQVKAHGIIVHVDTRRAGLEEGGVPPHQATKQKDCTGGIGSTGIKLLQDTFATLVLFSEVVPIRLVKPSRTLLRSIFELVSDPLLHQL